ncbi:hypothetical protein Afil01_51490 [Actinorhabdospora filicis]|uniref:Zinc ribbon domain-containing protein n=1 Tax=Actinorhabdospora filicis TaxID=1785913 RepID=A0A9W6SR51_9ACTN|nr:discoidin domain-containing protein [Actinorhabdospora filicis]GLZ80342.1 hypothetical protein Afil01_51490 [Actinorhabdospora filicis]
MTACPTCGAAVAQDDQFCGNCGEYLDWGSSASQQQPAAPTPAQAPYQAPTQAPVQQPVYPPPPAQQTGYAQPPAPQPGYPTPPPPVQGLIPPAVASRVPGVPQPPYGPPQAPYQPPQPVQPTQPVQGGPQAPVEPPPVQPGKVPDTPVRRIMPERRSPDAQPFELLSEGEVRCGPCGAVNPDTRKFCKRCGAELKTVDTVVEEKLSWWRRLFRRKRDPEDPRKWHAAGTRRSPRRIRIMRIIGIILVLGLILTAVALWPARSVVDSVINTVKDRFTSHVPVVPTEVRASSSGTNAKPEYVIDGVADRFWAPSGAGVDEWVEVQFKEPVRLTNIVVSSGSSKTPEDFRAQGRPNKVTFTITSKDGKVTTEEKEIQDQPDAQDFEFGISDVVTIRMTINSTFGYEAGKQVAVAELEFFKRK